MHAHTNPLMSRPAVGELRRAQARLIASALLGRPGVRGLHLRAGRVDSAINLAMPLQTRLYFDGDDPDGERWRGDIHARASEPLPFVDDAFDVVVLDDVLEWVPWAAALLGEAARVLSPHGCLLVAGFHPFSLWAPWLLCRRRPRPMLTAPGWIRQELARHDVDTVRVVRCGHAWPVAGTQAGPGHWGGGFVLTGRKRRATIVPWKVPRPQRANARKKHAWVPGTQRECA